MNKKEIQSILEELRLKPNKNLGQNFLHDKNIVSKIISNSNISRNDVVLEIGPGLGALTEELLKYTDKLYAYEIDLKLYQYLMKKFPKNTNLILFNEDILKVKLPKFDIVISNIPYTITGAIFEKIFYTENPPRGSLLIEDRIAERLFNKNNYKFFSRITVTFNAFMQPLKKFKIPSHTFFPAPKIDLALILVEPRDDIPQFLIVKENRTFFLKFIAGIMPYKNKNLVNAISTFLKNEGHNELTKNEVYECVDNFNLKERKIAQCKVDDLVKISKSIFHLIYG